MQPEIGRAHQGVMHPDNSGQIIISNLAKQMVPCSNITICFQDNIHADDEFQEKWPRSCLFTLFSYVFLCNK